MLLLRLYLTIIYKYVQKPGLSVELSAGLVSRPASNTQAQR